MEQAKKSDRAAASAEPLADERAEQIVAKAREIARRMSELRKSNQRMEKHSSALMAEITDLKDHIRNLEDKRAAALKHLRGIVSELPEK